MPSSKRKFLGDSPRTLLNDNVSGEFSDDFSIRRLVDGDDEDGDLKELCFDQVKKDVDCDIS